MQKEFRRQGRNDNADLVMRNKKEAVEYAEGKRRHGKEIHRRNRFTVIAKKCHSPIFWRWAPWRFPYPMEYRSLRNIEVQHIQLTMNAWRAPGGIFGDHAEDQFAQFPADASSSCSNPMPREPFPIQLESGPTPANNSLRLNEKQRTHPARPEPSQDHPEQLIGRRKPRLWMISLQDGELLLKRQVFDDQITA